MSFRRKPEKVELFEDFPDSIDHYADHLWSVEESKRFVMLAITRQDLLTFEEQKLGNSSLTILIHT